MALNPSKFSMTQRALEFFGREGWDPDKEVARHLMARAVPFSHPSVLPGEKATIAFAQSEEALVFISDPVSGHLLVVLRDEMDGLGTNRDIRRD